MNWLGKLFKKAERTLYHGTCTFNKADIQAFGLVPSVGPFVDEAYGGEYPNDFEFPELNFAADKQNIQVCLSAMERCIAHHLEKDSYKVTENDIKNYGLLLIFKGSPGSARPEDTGWEHRNEDDDRFDQDRYPQVEPGDYYSEGSERPSMMLSGNALIRFLKKNGIFINEQAERQHLINMVRKFHTNVPIQDIINKVNSLQRHEVSIYTNSYERELAK